MLRTYATKIIMGIARIGVEPDDSDDDRLKKAIIVMGVSAATLLFITVIAPLYLIFDEPVVAGGYLAFAGLTVANIAWFGWGHRDYHRLTTILGVVSLVTQLVGVVALGGFVNSGGLPLWGLVLPVLAILLLEGPRPTLPWFGAYALNVLVSFAIQPWLRPITNVPAGAAVVIFTINVLVISLFIALILAYFVSQRDQAFRLLGSEREKSENLLLNILPSDIAAILKKENRTIADHYEGVSILFADLVNFTPLSASMSPVELVELLNEVFSHFDALVEHYGLEKIKTIGDCYMVAAGVPRSRSDHALVLTALALDMQAYVSQRVFSNQRISFRIGINSGPVVAGVIGRKKFIYDLWGDAVNTASRMESLSKSGAIQITAATHALIEHAFVCEPQGLVEVKGKGAMEVWHVRGRRHALA